MIKAINCVKKYLRTSHFYEISIEVQFPEKPRSQFFRFVLHQPNANVQKCQLFFQPSEAQRKSAGGTTYAVNIANFDKKYWALYPSDQLVAKSIGKATEFVTSETLKQARAA